MSQNNRQVFAMIVAQIMGQITAADMQIRNDEDNRPNGASFPGSDLDYAISLGRDIVAECGLVLEPLEDTLDSEIFENERSAE